MANEMVNVRAVRVGLGLTQEAFCERFGLTLSVLRDWEQQRRHPSSDVHVATGDRASAGLG